VLNSKDTIVGQFDKAEVRAKYGIVENHGPVKYEYHDGKVYAFESRKKIKAKVIAEAKRQKFIPKTNTGIYFHVCDCVPWI
jgi:hypothetical protein